MRSARLSTRRRGLVGKAAAALLLAMLAACSGSHAQDPPPQRWQDAEVRVESRPSPPHAGMNEFLVMVTNSRGKPAHNLVVSFRANDHDDWKQAIQDGEMGVYRRAVRMEARPDSALQVQISGGGAEGVLYFPVAVQP